MQREGGNDPTEDVDLFEKEGGNILVATPGRLAALLERVPRIAGGVKGLELLVLDEADRLLDLGFEQAVNDILARMPKQRRTVSYGIDTGMENRAQRKGFGMEWLLENGA